MTKRTVIGYHGCDTRTANEVLLGKPLVPSKNDHDWLGHGIYFWEEGPQRALEWAQIHHKHPAVIGAEISIHEYCLDLLDTRYTEGLDKQASDFVQALRDQKQPLPQNARGAHRFDCAVINSFAARSRVDTVRCCFIEGEPLFKRFAIQSNIYTKSHIQIAVRNSTSIYHVFDLKNGPVR